MAVFRALRSLTFYGRVAINTELMDPIEVFYLPGTNTIYPIISKAGCSSLKLILLRRFLPDFYSPFPNIHWTDPAEVTSGCVQRLWFDSPKTYQKFCAGKDIVLIIRDPYQRLYSAYQGYQSGANPYYTDHPTFGRILGFTAPQSLRHYRNLCCSIPDRFADRHFRSQCFYLPQDRTNVASVTIETIETFDNRASNNQQNSCKRVVLNESGNKPGAEDLSVIQSDIFRRRYRHDLNLFAHLKAHREETDLRPLRL